jgi:hypothetical protein
MQFAWNYVTMWLQLGLLLCKRMTPGLMCISGDLWSLSVIAKAHETDWEITTQKHSKATPTPQPPQSIPTTSTTNVQNSIYPGPHRFANIPPIAASYTHNILSSFIPHQQFAIIRLASPSNVALRVS